MLHLNGSPYERRKDETREQLLGRRAPEVGAPIAYVNLVGGQDELVFDGGSFVVDARGRCWPAPRSSSSTCSWSTSTARRPRADAAASAPSTDPMTCERHEPSLRRRPPTASRLPAGSSSRSTTGRRCGRAGACTRDYVRKNGFCSVVLGLSGGIDSAVVATLAARRASAPTRARGRRCPAGGRQRPQLADAEDLAAAPGPALARAADRAGGRRLHRRARAAGGLTGLAAENLQARVRGTALMALSNEHGHLVLTTGNKSELAVGYSTLYGDTAGGFAPIKDVPKTLVWALARWRNAEAGKAARRRRSRRASISKPPQRRARPRPARQRPAAPTTTSSTPCSRTTSTATSAADDLLARGHDPALVERVLRLVDLAEYKRRQNPPGPKISLKAFGRDRRLPITTKWREPVQGAHPG